MDFGFNPICKKMSPLLSVCSGGSVSMGVFSSESEAFSNGMSPSPLSDCPEFEEGWGVSDVARTTLL